MSDEGKLFTSIYIIEFLEMLNAVSDKDMLLEELSHEHLKEEFRGKTLAEMDIRRKTGVSVIAIVGISGFRFNPETNVVIKEGEVAILLGQHTGIEEFRKVFCA